jgi:hypothetical protein
MAFFNALLQLFAGKTDGKVPVTPDIRSLGTHSIMISPRGRLIFIWQSEVRVT